jgi:hypothetical protein
MPLPSVRLIYATALILLPATAVAACGNGSSPAPAASGNGRTSASGGTSASGDASTPVTTSTPVSPAAPVTSAPAPSGGSAATVAQIKGNWVAFFNARTPVAKRVGLLQNGAEFASIIKSQAASSLAAAATSSVSAVTVESPSQAKVTFSILVSGTPALKNQPGAAVDQDGVWKVGDQSFCALLTLENSGKAPAACASAAG